VAYHWPTVLLSLLTAIFASAVALYVVSRKKMGRVQALTGSVVMGLGIAGMHYTGMAAMRLPAVCHYSPLLVTLSFLIAIIASLAALVFAFDYRVLLLSNADFSEVLFVNRAYEAIWGRTVESLYAAPRSWLEGVHPDDRQQVQEAVQSLMDGEPLDDLECRVVRPDGSISWVRVKARPIRDSQGYPYRLVGCVHEFTKRKQAEDAVRQLSGQLLRWQDEARRKIARDLHDSTGQNLVVLAMMLDQLRDSIPSGERKSRRLLSECKALAELCVREVRTLSYVLHPPVLDEAGLEEAIRDYVNGFTKRSGIRVELELPTRLGRMPREVELTLFRVVQEALTNIQRHSGSQQAKIRIYRNSHLTLEISDLGQGVSASTPQGKEGPPFQVGVGIPSMQERVKLIGGQLDVHFSSDGTTVRVTIPLAGDRT
jgi:PAS domain S-box-containing protein